MRSHFRLETILWSLVFAAMGYLLIPWAVEAAETARAAARASQCHNWLRSSPGCVVLHSVVVDEHFELLQVDFNAYTASVISDDCYGFMRWLQCSSDSEALIELKMGDIPKSLIEDIERQFVVFQNSPEVLAWKTRVDNQRYAPQISDSGDPPN